MSSGAVPPSQGTGPLAAGNYGFQAVYSGDSHYNGSTSPCEPFSVAVGSSMTATVVFDASTITTSGPVMATGTVSYTLYANGVCSGSGVSAGTVTLTTTGAVPNSITEGPLAAGPYSFQATYSDDNNYLPSTSSCESFTVSSGSVGGVTLPVDKLGLVVPFIESSLLVLAATVTAFLYLRRARKSKLSA